MLTTLPLTVRPRPPPPLPAKKTRTAAAKDERLRDLHRQTRGDRLPPQLRQRFGLREEMAEQHQRRRADEQDDDRRAQ